MRNPDTLAFLALRQFPLPICRTSNITDEYIHSSPGLCIVPYSYIVIGWNNGLFLCLLWWTSKKRVQYCSEVFFSKPGGKRLADLHYNYIRIVQLTAWHFCICKRLSSSLQEKIEFVGQVTVQFSIPSSTVSSSSSSFSIQCSRELFSSDNSASSFKSISTASINRF